MTRARIVLVLDLADDDQTDEQAVQDVVEFWVRKGIEEDFKTTGVHWPPTGRDGDPGSNWRVEEVTMAHSREELK